MPKVSVIIGIYNVENTLEEALDSLLEQTFQDFEIVLCDDGSMDNTLKVAEAYVERFPEKCILLKNEHNMGLNYTLNHCLEHASGEYIARMDGDDLCDKTRFEKQVTFLDEHPEYGIVSTPMLMFDETGIWGRTKAIEAPTPEQVVTGSPICHAPAMLRKECYDAVGGYTVDTKMLRVEDVNLWIKLYAAGYRCYNLQEPLYLMRNDQAALNRRKYRYRVNSVYVRLKGCRLLKLRPICYLKSIKPMIVGLVPARLRMIIRKLQDKNGGE